ncbi:MAG: SPOR domain-containing protein [Alphaproteobacteria bacterium]|nr:SPOR domain-containing protein [Alphaproteobacteria bacterium]MBU1513161.1 SPOR domain-containing protein [Alphaproteobacteria bacterium]MBU2095269.1 SPOR domain-containing protein [Alphaproteobacteria bacterium]MBU2152184.1 SPOR domain-containing protein [Alphaproteobacteria bacterium]MBU2306769.1 SPOR domain-containing protein [Alphaproteobacteria bacterium]
MRFTGVAMVAAGVWLAAASLGMAQNAVVFPPSLEREPLLAWLQRETDIAPERVVAVTPQALTSIVSTFPAGPGAEPRVVIRAEALSAETYARTGALSWHVSMSADCKSRRVRLGDTTGYQERNLLGERKLLRSAEPEWRTPEPGTALDAAWRSTCEKDFKGPFKAQALTVAQPDASTPNHAAAPSVPARSPAAVVPPAAAKPAATPAPKPVAAAAPKSGGLVVQVGSSPSEAEARALLAALKPRLGDRKAWIETAQVDGKTWRRAVVGGFTDGADAARFCADLKAAGRGCFVRAGRSG